MSNPVPHIRGWGSPNKTAIRALGTKQEGEILQNDNLGILMSKKMVYQPLCYREYLQVQHSCSPPLKSKIKRKFEIGSCPRFQCAL